MFVFVKVRVIFAKLRLKLWKSEASELDHFLLEKLDNRMESVTYVCRVEL